MFKKTVHIKNYNLRFYLPEALSPHTTQISTAKQREWIFSGAEDDISTV